ncbi:MAG: hypothetical protein Kow00122_19490 [Thermoleophilia bacterium]
MKKLMIGGVLVVLLLGLLSAMAFSAPPPQSASVTVNATINQAAWLNIADPTVDLTADPSTGVPGTDTLAVSVRANWAWDLTVDPMAATITNTSGPGGASVTLDTSKITLSNGAASFDAATGGTIASGAQTAGTDITVDYSLTASWTDDPGSWSGTQLYTLSFQ